MGAIIFIINNIIGFIVIISIIIMISVIIIIFSVMIIIIQCCSHSYVCICTNAYTGNEKGSAP
eukprot:3760263-Karenia_brevis.AAC.1